MPVKPIPDGYHTVTPYLIMKDASRALAFYQQAFGARELVRMPMPDGTLMHGEFQIGDSPIMLGEASVERGYPGPENLGGTPVSIVLYVEDVDALFKRGVDAGCTVVREVVDQFYGDRSGTLKDPFGHIWTIGTHKEDLSPEEMEKRMQEAMKG